MKIGKWNIYIVSDAAMADKINRLLSKRCYVARKPVRKLNRKLMDFNLGAEERFIDRYEDAKTVKEEIRKSMEGV